MGQNWENNGKAGGAVCPAGTSPCLESEHQNFRSSHMKNEKAGLAMVWVMGEESEGNLEVMPRFQSRNDSNLDQLQAGHLPPRYLPGSQLHRGKTKAASAPKSFELKSFPLTVGSPHEQHCVEVWKGFPHCNSVFQLK